VDDGNRDFLTGGAAGKRPRGGGEADDEPPEINPEDEFDLHDDDDDAAMYAEAMAVEDQEVSIPESSKKRWCRCEGPGASLPPCLSPLRAARARAPARQRHERRSRQQ
jgi:hypothetical protein